MITNLLETVQSAVTDVDVANIWGKVDAIDSGVVHISGLHGVACIGDRVKIEGPRIATGEVISIEDDHVSAMPNSSLSGITLGARVHIHHDDGARPHNAWLGRVLNAFGEAFDGTPVPKGTHVLSLCPVPLAASERRGLGARINTGLAPFDTFLPLCRGQRIGLFAGSGVGKSTLIADLAKGVEADVVVIALIGERSREIREFAEQTLSEKHRTRSVIIVSTCDEPAPSKRRAALLAMTTAEYFRDQGLHVLLLFDSITRFADAHREIGLTAGETPSLRAYPPSTTRTIAALAERAGPGIGAAGDITAVFSVLVAGSDMDEPVADMVRGILDGHVVLDRSIAERGRFPAINIRRSVSRSLPHAASQDENQLLSKGRELIAAYEEAATMIQTGLYAKGSDPTIDRAIELWPQLDRFVGEKFNSCTDSFQHLSNITNPSNKNLPAIVAN